MAIEHARVIVAGAINVDLILRVHRLPLAGESVHGHHFVQQGGGKAANQAIAARRMGAPVTLIGAVGDDDQGRAALATLAAEGVDVSHCRVLRGSHTGLAMILVDDRGENQIAVAPGANRVLEASDIEAALQGLEPVARDLCLVTLELEEPAVGAVAGWAAAHGLRLILDPAPARAIPDGVLGTRPILTPNELEATRHTGLGDPSAAAEALALQTASPVIVTRGANGALLWADGRAIAVPALAVEAVDETGAGDALNGILAAELARGSGLEEALRLAVVGAALSTTVPGAQAGLPTRDEVVTALARL